MHPCKRITLLVLQVEDINLNVGSGTSLGESIIQDVKELSVVIRRSLRDLLHKIPNIEAAIKVIWYNVFQSHCRLLKTDLLIFS